MGCRCSVNLFDGNSSQVIAPSPANATTLKAVLLIQNHFRRYRAKCEARKQMLWNIHELLEYSVEQNQIMMQKLFTMTLNHDKNCRRGDYHDMQSDDFHLLIDSDSVSDSQWNLINTLDAAYTGFRIEYPLTIGTVKELIDFLQMGNKKLANRDIVELVIHARVLLRSQDNVNVVCADSITIVGDLHGNFDDLITIFRKNCLPSSSNQYIFNGDFVDRGSQSVEVIIVLFACFLLNPRATYLNRGNHEDYMMNARYGFFKELRAKYQEISDILIRLFTETFALLPLATLLNESVLVVHGGISTDTDLAIIKSLRREKFASVLHFEFDNVDADTITEWKQVLNVLWSDPRPSQGCKLNTRRGGGSLFGPDVTAAFLSRSRLKLLVRSHECKMSGWEYTHDRQVLTIFSASSYYELGSNFGAFAVISGRGDVAITEYRSQDSLSLR